VTFESISKLINWWKFSYLQNVQRRIIKKFCSRAIKKKRVLRRLLSELILLIYCEVWTSTYLQAHLKTYLQVASVRFVQLADILDNCMQWYQRLVTEIGLNRAYTNDTYIYYVPFQYMVTTNYSDRLLVFSDNQLITTIRAYIWLVHWYWLTINTLLECYITIIWFGLLMLTACLLTFLIYAPSKNCLSKI